MRVTAILYWPACLGLMAIIAMPVTASNWSVSVAKKDKSYAGKKSLYLWSTEVGYIHENLEVSLEYTIQSGHTYRNYKTLKTTAAYKWNIDANRSAGFENEVKFDLHNNSIKSELKLDYRHQLHERYRYKTELEPNYYRSTGRGLSKGKFTPSFEYILTNPQCKFQLSIGLPMIIGKNMDPKLIKYKANYSLVLAENLLFKVTYELTDRLSGHQIKEKIKIVIEKKF